MRRPLIKENMNVELEKLYQKNNPSQQNASNEIWITLKTNIQIATKNVLGQQRRENIKPCMTDEILDLMLQLRLPKKKIWTQK